MDLGYSSSNKLQITYGYIPVQCSVVRPTIGVVTSMFSVQAIVQHSIVESLTRHSVTYHVLYLRCLTIILLRVQQVATVMFAYYFACLYITKKILQPTQTTSYQPLCECLLVVLLSAGNNGTVTSLFDLAFAAPSAEPRLRSKSEVSARRKAQQKAMSKSEVTQ